MIEQEQQNVNRSGSMKWPLIIAGGLGIGMLACLGAIGVYGFWEGGGKDIVIQSYLTCQNTNPGLIAMSIQSSLQSSPLEELMSNIPCTIRTVMNDGIGTLIGLALSYWARQLGPREHNT